MISKYSINIFKYIFFIAALTSITLPAYSELSVEEIIKGRKALFSKNYSTAKRVQTFVIKGDFAKASSLMREMSKNYITLLEYFPDDAKEGFKTKALPSIWENKDEFNNLMKKSSTDMIELIKVIDSSDDVKATLQKFMWANCKACHSQYRAGH